MDIYHIWFDLKPGTPDTVLTTSITAFLGHMEGAGLIENWRLMRCKLGLRPTRVPEFHVMIETKSLAQLDEAFKAAARRSGDTDTLHFAANATVCNVEFGLFRDWPDTNLGDAD